VNLNLFTKIMALAGLQYGLGIVANLLIRYAMKTGFGEEVSAASWYSLSFLSSLPATTVLCIAAVFVINVSSFPISAWIGSFSLGLSWPVVSIVTVSAEALMIPLNLYVFKTLFNEMTFGTMTILGLGILEGSKAASIVGLYFIYLGGGAV
jgi:hypothetical protein